MCALTSARNELRGIIRSLRSGAVNDEVLVALNDKDTLKATVTCESSAALGLKPGLAVVAVIQASQLLLTSAPAPAVSAGNCLCGRVVARRDGAVSSEIDVELSGGGRLVAMISEGAAGEMAITCGDEVCVLFAASSVLLALSDDAAS